MKRVAIVASHVIQYQAPFFQRLARERDIELTVFYCSRAGAEVYRDADMQTELKWDVDLLGGYDHRFLRNLGFGRRYTRLINPGLVPALVRGNYDAVFFFLGWGSVTALLGMLTCHAIGTPFFLFGDSFHRPGAPPESSLRIAVFRALFSLPTGFLASGVRNAQFYRAYGAKPDRFFLVPWAVDNDRFAASAQFAPGEREAMRARFGIEPDQIAIVFSAKLIPRKDPLTLLRAVARMKHRDRAVVIMLGHGELREELEQLVKSEKINVRFAGFVNQLELAKHYAMSDVFVLPTLYEPRGSVINEAMAAGLPILVTDYSGSVGDIVLDGENAMIFPAGDADVLARQLDTLVENPELRERLGRRSREIIAGWSYDRGVEGVKEALRACT